MSSPAPRAVIGGGGRGAWRGEETRPFPSMAPSPPPSGLQQLDNYNSGGEEEGIVGASDEGERSPIHPGEGNIFNFHSGEGSQSPVKLTHLAPISPTNEDVHSSAELRSNPQPPISSSFLQVLSPARAGGAMGTYAPFLFPGHHPPVFQMHDNEKYRKAMMKKQRRENKKDKNVRNVYQAKDVEGHKDEDIDSILQSLGEKGDDKKIKAKKGKEKNEKGKVEKRERGKRSVEKELEEQTEKVDNEDLVKENIKNIKRVNTPDPITSELIDFKNNFCLVTPEPGPLAKTKSREALVASTESLTQFTKVTKKHRGKRAKDEVPPVKPQPPTAPQEPSRRTSGYALRSRDVQPAVIRLDSSSSDPAIQSSVNIPPVNVPSLNLENNFPKLAKDDFPALPGGKEVSTPILPSAWSRIVTSNHKEVTPQVSDSEEVIINEDNAVQELKDVKEFNEEIDSVKDASDSKAVINCDVPSNSDIIDCIEPQEENPVVDNEISSNDKVIAGSDDNVRAEDEEEVIIKEYPCVTNGENDLSDGERTETEEIIEADKDIEVVISEDEFNKKKADNSAPVVILGESDKEWKTSEFSFGFAVNHDLVASSGQESDMERVEIVQQEMIQQIPGSFYASMGPGAPLTPIDSVDGAILSFGGPESAGLRPLIVGVPVGVPVPVSVGAGGTMHAAAPYYFPPPFPHFGLPFPVAGPVPTANHFQDQEEPELSGQEIVHEDEQDKTGPDHQEHQTISPESGISSASPLSWQPDSSPSLAAPGSYPHHTSPPLVNHVNQSLSGWQGHSGSSSPANSSRNSPTPPGWATQVENLSFNDKQEKNNNYSPSLKDRKDVEDHVNDDSGLSIETGENNSQELREKFNLGEIVTFISSSWSNVSKDSSLQVYSNNSTTASSS